MRAAGLKKGTEAQTRNAVSHPVPLVFEQNQGQLPAPIDFLARTREYSVAVHGSSLSFQLPGGLPGAPLTISLEHASATHAAGRDEASFRTNSFVGDDPSRWHTGIQNYRRIYLSGIYPGIDSELYANRDQIEHDFLVAPGVDANTIAMRFDGAKSVRLDADGDIVVSAADGELRLKRPVAYQEDAQGQRVPVAASFVLGNTGRGSRRLHFALGRYDHARRLIIDPVIVYSSFVAGAAGSAASTVASDAAGNVYLAGTTSSANFGPAPAPIANCSSAPCPGNLFVVKFASGSNGATPSWISYIGESTLTMIAATSSAANSSTVYIGGYTNATALASGAATSASNATGGYVGFLSGLNAADGTLAGTNFIDVDSANPNNVSVQAVALDSGGDVYLAGAMGTSISPPAGTYSASPNAFAVTPATTTYVATAAAQPGNAYVLEYAAGSVFAAGSPAFFTYIQTGTMLQGIAVDAANNIYIAGQTFNGFTPLVSAGSSAPTPLTNTSGANDAFEMTFQIVAAPGPPTVSAFTWIDSNGNTTVASLGIDGLGNSYLFGNTVATNLGTALGLTGGCSLQCTLPDVAGSGYVAELNNTGMAVGYTYLGGSGATDVVNAGVFAGGEVYVAGQTDAPASAGGTAVPFAAAPNVQTATAPFNAQALAFGQDLTTSGTAHGYVASLPAALASTNYVANIGGAGGPGGDTVAAIALDGAGNVYAAANIGHASTPYVPYNVFQATSPATSAASAYLAEIANSSSLYGLTLAAAPGSPSVDPLGYVSTSDSSAVNYTWKLNATANVPASNVLLSIASQANLNFVSAQVTDGSASGAAVGTCSLGAQGVSCVIPVFPQTSDANDTLFVTLSAAVNATPFPPSGQISVTATALSPASETASATQVSHLSAPSNLQITLGAPSVSSVFAASANYASYHGATVTYPIIVTNVGASPATGEAPAASLAVSSTLPVGFKITGVAAVASAGAVINTCDSTSAATGCTSVDLPAGAAVTYSITGYFDDATLFTASSTASSLAASGGFSASANGFLNTVASTALTIGTTTIQRAVDIATSSSVATFDGLNPGTAKSTFNLSTAKTPAPVNYVFTVANAGPSIVYGATLAAAYPLAAGTTFVATAASGTDSASVPAACTFASSLSCTVGQIAPGKSATVTLTASYPDLAPAADAVPAGKSSNPYSVTATAATPNYFQAYVTGSTSENFPASTVTVQRTAALTVAIQNVTAVAPNCLGAAAPCVYMFNPSANLNPNANQYDSASYTAVVTNAGPNASTATSIAIPLPAAPATTGTTPTTHVLATSSATATPSSTPAGWSAANLISSCALSSGQFVCGGAATGIPAPTSTGTLSSVSVTFSGTFDASTVPVTVASVNTSAQPGSVSVAASVSNAPPAATPLQTYSVVRSSHLVIRKTRNAAVAAAPVAFSDTTDPNLDEKTTATAFGVNDEVEYAVALGNGGVDDAAGVQFTDTLPPYFTVLKSFLVASTSTTPDTGANGTPAGTSIGTPVCYAGATVSGSALVLPYVTGSSSMQITCTVPAGYVLPADKSVTGSPGASGIEFVYQGKFQDNAPNADTILAGASKYTVGSAAGDASVTSSLAADYLASSDHLSLALPAYAIQRAGHLAVYATALDVAPAGAPAGPDQTLPLDPATSVPEIAEAEPGNTAAAGAPPVASGPVVFNCMRYKVYVQNTGPNVSRTPTVTVTGDQFVFNNIATGTTTTPASDAALASSCSSKYGAPVSSKATAASLVPTSESANNSMVVDLDGYFDLKTLTFARDGTSACLGNCGTRTATLAAPSDPGLSDSNTKDVQPSKAIPSVEVVNTPAGNNFVVAPFSATGTQPVSLAFSSVTAAGVTRESIAATGPALPIGKSPYPLDPRPASSQTLYEPGRAPMFYTLPTTAIAPTAGVNKTTLCVSNPGSPALADVFVKPERTLLWLLQAPPAGTTYNTVPNITANAAYGTGDITSFVMPSLGTAYAAQPVAAVPPNPQAPQAQPAQVCGVLNGFSSGAPASTVAVLEPVNFPPVVAGASYTKTIGTTAGKGANDSLNTVQIMLGKGETYDYNDSDPCYVGSATSRGVCNDNPYLYAWVFGGGNIGGGGGSQTLGPVALGTGQLFTNVDLATVSQIFVAVADQTMWADANDPTIASPAYPGGNPFTNDGNFLRGPLNTANNTYPVCDPGIGGSNYTPSFPACSTGGLLPQSSAYPLPETYVSGGGTGRVAIYQLGSVGAVGVSGSSGIGGAGLVSLPFPDASTPATSPLPINPLNPVVPIVWPTVTAGQTAGFSWGWLASEPLTGTYNLSCFMVDAATQAVTTPMPAGMSCNLPATYTFGSTPAPPSIYIVTTGTLNAHNLSPSIWGGVGGAVLALVVPLFFGRRRRSLRRQFNLTLLLLVLAGVATLSGCGAGFTTQTPQVTPAGTYYFRAKATSGTTTITTAPFEVIVLNGD